MKNKALKAAVLLSILILLAGLGEAAGQEAVGSPEAGKVVYEQNCFNCHGQYLEGGIGVALRDNDFIKTSEIPAIREVIIKGREDKGMPIWGGKLSEQEITDVAAFLKNPGELVQSLPLSSIKITVELPESELESKAVEMKKQVVYIYALTLLFAAVFVYWAKGLIEAG